MKKISGKLTVFFENPFWVGIFEDFENDNLSVCKVTFGSEPKEYEIYDFILKKFYNLHYPYFFYFYRKKIQITAIFQL